jgi:hypothetical protein
VNKTCHTWGSIAIITNIIIIVIMFVATVLTLVVGARTLQSVGYEMEDQRIAIRFHRPILALAITEPPIQRVLPKALGAHTLDRPDYVDKS